VVCVAHLEMLEAWVGDSDVVDYTDRSKKPSVGRATVAWITFERGIAGVLYGISVPPF